MPRRPAAVLALAVLAASGAAAAPASAAPRVLRGSYETGVTVPDPTTGGLPHDTCDGLPTSRSQRRLALPSAGVLTVTLTATGDWGLAVRDPRGRTLRRADSAVSAPERLVLRRRGRGTVVLEACNFAGAPTARVSYVFRSR
ncbi:MAG: hypothetical protein JWN17_1601 [Frankiales bacterium]|nr:hypothetical protein [Frankiales bacterium]